MATIKIHHGQAHTQGGQYHGYKTHASTKRVIEYITRQDKTREDLIHGKYCSPQNAYEEFILNKLMWNKTEDGNRKMVIHFSQNFAPEDHVTPEMALEIADRLIQHELFQGYQAVYAVHIDTGNLHTHFVVDTCNLETGLQYHDSKLDLQRLKDYSDQLCREYKLSVCQKTGKKAEKTKGEVVVREQGASWKEEIRLAAMACSKVAVSRGDFIWQMRELGFDVTWKDEHKYIVFSDRAGHRVRHHRLEPVGYFAKEELLKQFAINRQIRDMNQKETMQDRQGPPMAAEGFRNIMWIAKNLTRMGGDYPLQNNPDMCAMDRANTQAAMADYIAEQKKGQGYEKS